MRIPGEDESQRNKHLYREWRCDSLKMHILTGNENAHPQEERTQFIHRRVKMEDCEPSHKSLTLIILMIIINMELLSTRRK